MTEIEKRVCRTCAYVRPGGQGFYKGNPTCGSYIGPRRGKMVVLDETTCSKHVTPVEAKAHGIVYTSIDDSKSRVKEAGLEVLRLARQIETAGANRVSLIKAIDARIKKLEKTK
jgi:hypothetical protein